MAGIELRSLSKTYDGAVPALEPTTLDIRDGELLVLVGPSGCGKSTLLRLIAGLETPTSGTVRIGGEDVTQLVPKERDVAMVFQSYALYPHMSVAENLGFGLKLRKTPQDEVRVRVERAAAILGLDSLLERKPKALSGGQRQRVALGRALVREPRVFLLDEPLSNLDAALRVEMRGEIRNLHRRLGTTMVYVTHDQVEAMTLADTLVVMREGRVLQCAPPGEVYAAPADIFVARFIGSPAMNLFPGRVEEGRFIGDGIALPGSPPTRGAVTLGVRPEHLEPALEDGALHLGVEAVEPLGHATLVHGTVGDAPVVARVSPGLPVSPGDTLPMRVSDDHLHWFDAESGKRLGNGGSP